MRHYVIMVGTLLFMACASTQVINDWKNPEVDNVDINKVLVIGMTSNYETRQSYENKLKIEFELRGIEAVTSLSLFEPDFTTEEKSKEELNRIEQILIANGFDAILFTKVIGIEDKINYSEEFVNEQNLKRRFKEEYLMYQDVFYNPEYYQEYSVYHTESSLYCICPTKERELVWKGYIDITDPTSRETAIKEYVKLIMSVFEEQLFIEVLE